MPYYRAGGGLRASSLCAGDGLSDKARHFMRWLSVIAVLLAVGCIVPAPSAERSGSAPARVAAPPSPPAEVRNGAVFDGKVEMVGAVLNPGRAQAGESVKVTVTYKVLEEVAADYIIFVHVEDIDGRVDRINADHAPAGGTYPTSRWKKGDVVKDEYVVYVPPTMPVRGLTILTGFWDPKSDGRMAVKNPEAVRHDGNNRVMLAQVPVIGAQQQ